MNIRNAQEAGKVLEVVDQDDYFFRNCSDIIEQLNGRTGSGHVRSARFGSILALANAYFLSRVPQSAGLSLRPHYPAPLETSQIHFRGFQGSRGAALNTPPPGPPSP